MIVANGVQRTVTVVLPCERFESGTIVALDLKFELVFAIIDLRGLFADCTTCFEKSRLPWSLCRNDDVSVD